MKIWMMNISITGDPSSFLYVFLSPSNRDVLCFLLNALGPVIISYDDEKETSIDIDTNIFSLSLSFSVHLIMRHYFRKQTPAREWTDESSST